MSAPSAVAGRTRAFQTLKPVCVHLSEVAAGLAAGRSSGKQVVAALSNLQATLSLVADSNDGFDSKLAEYVFFPISHVFRASALAPVKALELSLDCLQTLLQTGWRTIGEPNLAVQLLILLSFLLAGKGTSLEQHRRTSEELQVLAFASEARLFKSIKDSSKCRDALFASSNLPALGHSITVMLDGAKDGASVNIQLQALEAFQQFQEHVATRDVCASFLPGIVSSYTQILTPTTQSRRSFKVLVLTLSILTNVIKLVLSDIQPIAPSPSRGSPVKKDDETAPILSASWLKATAGQMKLALANITKLRKHERAEVRNALAQLCMAILEDCPDHLSESRALAIETIVTLSLYGDGGKAHESIASLIAVDADLAELLRDSVYSWIVALPRVMLSNDDTAKDGFVARISEAMRLLSYTTVDLNVLTNTLLNNLRDAAANMIGNSSVPMLDASKEADLDLVLAASPGSVHNPGNEQFETVLAGTVSSRDIMHSLQTLIQQVSATDSSVGMARDFLDQARFSQGDLQLVTLWLSLSTAKAKASVETTFEDVVNFEGSNEHINEVSEELFSYALSLLSQAEDDSGRDWRLQALALEALAFHAERLKKHFRIELVDALYPVVQLMGSQNAALRRHALTCLNVFASSCGYSDAKDLLVSNVDYLVNAVAMKLNAFDISPQAPQVLLMMTRLCGPSLIPYLDDLVTSIFEALECFHGYPKLVELLFSVLNVIVEEGVRAPLLAITTATNTTQPSSTNENLSEQPRSVGAVAESLKARRANLKLREHDGTNSSPSTNDLPESTPHKPWQDLRRPEPPSEDSSPPDGEDPSTAPTPTEDATKLSKPNKTVHAIAELTQHHLPSSSPSLRLALLTLLHTALPHLAAHEDTFLPTINTLWPVLVPRLRDREAYVVAAALDVARDMCAGAGDFMRGRVEEVWPVLRRLHAETEAQVQAHSHAASARARVSGAQERDASRAQGQGARPLQTLSRNELLTAGAASHGATKPHPQQQQHQQLAPRSTANTYTPTTARTVRRALTRLVATIIKAVPSLRASLFAEALGLFLRGALLSASSREGPLDSGGAGDGNGNGDGDEELREAREAYDVLRQRNADAVWLLLERERCRADAEGGAARREWWRRRVPAPVRGRRDWLESAGGESEVRFAEVVL